MKNCLLFLAIVGVMLVAAPAHSQYLFLDINGDGKNSQNPLFPAAPDDVLSSSIHSVDVYFTTNANRNGSPDVCSSGEPDFQINSYEFILRTSGNGSVTFGAWTDNMVGMLGGTLCGDGTVCQGGGDIWVAKYKFTYDPPGTYKVGSLALTVTGSPKLDFVTGTSLHPIAGTSFGSSCSGSQGDHTIRLGMDFTDADGTESPTPVTSTTWGKIKNLYH